MAAYTPAELGGYKPGASVHDTYHCWAAAQYREKVRVSDLLISVNLIIPSSMRLLQARTGRHPHRLRHSIQEEHGLHLRLHLRRVLESLVHRPEQ